MMGSMDRLYNIGLVAWHGGLQVAVKTMAIDWGDAIYPWTIYTYI